MSYDDFIKYTPKTFDIFLEAQTQVEKDNFFLENKRFGTLCAVIAGLFSKKKYKASDFFPIKEKRREPQTVDKMASANAADGVKNGMFDYRMPRIAGGGAGNIVISGNSIVNQHLVDKIMQQAIRKMKNRGR